MQRKLFMIFVFVALLGVQDARAEGYVGLFGGIDDVDRTFFPISLGSVTTAFEDGETLGLAIGRHREHWRLEVEIASRAADVESHILTVTEGTAGTRLAGSTGEISSLSLMGNAIYEFNPEHALTVYIGGGIGFSQVEAERFGVAAIPRVLEADDDVFAYQAFLGLELELGESWGLFAEYRLFATEDIAATTSVAAGSLSWDLSYETRDINFGLRIFF